MITIDAGVYKSVQTFAAKNDIRWYLNGVYVCRKFIAATDGNALIVVPTCDMVKCDSDAAILPRIPPSQLIGTVACDAGRVVVTKGSSTSYVSPIDATPGDRFPDISRVCNGNGWDKGLRGPIGIAYLRAVIDCCRGDCGVHWFTKNTQFLAMFSGGLPRGSFALVMARRDIELFPESIDSVF